MTSYVASNELPAINSQIEPKKFTIKRASKREKNNEQTRNLRISNAFCAVTKQRLSFHQYIYIYIPTKRKKHTRETDKSSTRPARGEFEGRSTNIASSSQGAHLNSLHFEPSDSIVAFHRTLFDDRRSNKRRTLSLRCVTLATRFSSRFH
jgi:hypothetical protein